MSRLVTGWRGFWKDFNSNQEWIFPDRGFPPGGDVSMKLALSASCEGTEI